jgi:cyclopropane fatty-acyl-phospholipid synthase-like methyltransferase
MSPTYSTHCSGITWLAERGAVVNWEKYWSTYPATVRESDYFGQVGKTVHGQAISSFQFQCIVEDIVSRLDLQPDDVLLDLCCGNGIITSKLASKCRKVIGVDYSESLLSIAKRDHQSENIHYVHASIMDLDLETLSATGTFSKVLMYEALQHFSKKELRKILSITLSQATADASILIGSIPDRTRKRNFYNTPKRLIVAAWRQVTARNAIGSWWTPNEFQRISEQMKLQCQILSQNEAIHTAHYRFDALLRRIPSMEN